MKLKIFRDDKFKEPCVTVEYSQETRQINDLINAIKLYGNTIQAEQNGNSMTVSFRDIYYFESVDDNSYIYTKTDVFSTSHKLYKIEEMIENTSFVRVSKSCIVNIAKLKSVKPFLNGRFEGTMLNGEKIIINRHYVADFKKRFGL